MTSESLTLIANLLITPVMVLVTMWFRSLLVSSERRERREDGFIEGLVLRVDTLEKEIREVRAELKNRDAEYIDLYKQYTTLKGKYDVLLVDHEKLKKDYEVTAAELAVLKTDLTKKAEVTTSSLSQMKSI